jgi:hypothetical protein
MMGRLGGVRFLTSLYIIDDVFEKLMCNFNLSLCRISSFPSKVATRYARYV